MASKQISQMGVYAFLIGILLSIILAIPGVLTGSMMLYGVIVLGILGIVVGLVNVTDKEVPTYLLATVAIVVSAAGLGSVFMNLGTAVPAVKEVALMLAVIMGNLVAFFGVGAAIVAIKSLYTVAKDQ